MSRTKRYWTLQIVCWGIYLIYITISILNYHLPFTYVLFGSILNFLLFISVTHLYRLTIKPLKIESLKWYMFLIYPIVGNFILAILILLLNTYVLKVQNILTPNHGKKAFLDYIFMILDSFRFSMPWFIFYHGIKFAERAIRNERDKLEAQMQLKVTELENLKNQINPHFLFNSLNSIRSLTLTDPKMAREATTKLSDLLRTSLTYTDLQNIPFEEELNLVIDYLSLEKIRFEERLTYQLDISIGTKKALIPPMSLQLLAENAVKHGISKSKNGGEIIVFAKKRENNLIFGVKNTGTLTHSKEEKRKGIGLENLRKRLLLNYGLNGVFRIFTEQNFVISEICIPLKIK